MEIADGRKPDRFGVVWPKGYKLCPVCRQPDDCGDCDHSPLSAADVAQIITGLSVTAP